MACLKDVLNLPIGKHVKIRITDYRDATIYEDSFVNGCINQTFMKYQDAEIVYIEIKDTVLTITLDM